jgi:hypothetical protein
LARCSESVWFFAGRADRVGVAADVQLGDVPAAGQHVADRGLGLLDAVELVHRDRRGLVELRRLLALDERLAAVEHDLGVRDLDRHRREDVVAELALFAVEVDLDEEHVDGSVPLERDALVGLELAAAALLLACG